MSLRFGSKPLVIAGVITVAVVACGSYVVLSSSDRPPLRETERTVKVKRVTSGGKIDIDYQPDNTLVYAGIRSPYPGEPMEKESTEYNRRLVAGKEIRLRFDEKEKEKDGDWLAYVYVGRTMVNEHLIRAGLAYVRLREGERRFSKELLAAQLEAQAAHRGIWKASLMQTAAEYPADRKHAAFHRPDCKDVKNTRPENAVKFKTKEEAFAAGFAPCGHCRP